MCFLACSFVPAAGLCSLPQASLTIHLLFIMHGTLLVYCKHRALHHHSLQREAETDGKMGSRFKKNPIRMRSPMSCQAHCLVFVTPWCYDAWDDSVPYVLSWLANFMMITRTDQCYLNSLKPAGLSLLKFQPEGISLANSLVARFQCRILSEDISAEKKCWAETEEAGERDRFLVSGLTGLGLL